MRPLGDGHFPNSTDGPAVLFTCNHIQEQRPALHQDLGAQSCLLRNWLASPTRPSQYSPGEAQASPMPGTEKTPCKAPSLMVPLKAGSFPFRKPFPQVQDTTELWGFRPISALPAFGGLTCNGTRTSASALPLSHHQGAREMKHPSWEVPLRGGGETIPLREVPLGVGGVRSGIIHYVTTRGYPFAA